MRRPKKQAAAPAEEGVRSQAECPAKIIDNMAELEAIALPSGCVVTRGPPLWQEAPRMRTRMFSGPALPFRGYERSDAGGTFRAQPFDGALQQRLSKAQIFRLIASRIIPKRMSRHAQREHFIAREGFVGQVNSAVDEAATGTPVLHTLWRNLQYATQGDLCGRLSHHDLEIAWHDPPLHIRIEQL